MSPLLTWLLSLVASLTGNVSWNAATITGIARLAGCAIFAAALVFGDPSFLAKLLGGILVADTVGHLVEHFTGGGK